MGLLDQMATDASGVNVRGIKRIGDLKDFVMCLGRSKVSIPNMLLSFSIDRDNREQIEVVNLNRRKGESPLYHIDESEFSLTGSDDISTAIGKAMYDCYYSSNTVDLVLMNSFCSLVNETWSERKADLYNDNGVYELELECKPNIFLQMCSRSNIIGEVYCSICYMKNKVYYVCGGVKITKDGWQLYIVPGMERTMFSIMELVTEGDGTEEADNLFMRTFYDLAAIGDFEAQVKNSVRVEIAPIESLIKCVIDKTVSRVHVDMKFDDNDKRCLSIVGDAVDTLFLAEEHVEYNYSNLRHSISTELYYYNNKVFTHRAMFQLGETQCEIFVDDWRDVICIKIIKNGHNWSGAVIARNGIRCFKNPVAGKSYISDCIKSLVDRY